jgi:tetratricopeptide (TPR) repeat protein
LHRGTGAPNILAMTPRHRRRPYRLALAAALLAPPLALGPAAQAQPSPPGSSRSPGAQAAAPRPGSEEARKAELERLFEALREAPDEGGGSLVESRIWAIWAQGATPSVQLLMRRGMRNIEARLLEEALEDFDGAITLAPDFAEAWHRRAQAHAAAGDAAAAARDLQEALRLEPRHFAALATLSALQEEAGDLRGALRSFEAALAIHPRLRGGEARLRDLRRRALGEDT